MADEAGATAAAAPALMDPEADPPARTRAGGGYLAKFWRLVDDVCSFAVRGSPLPTDANRYVAAYKEVYDLCTGSTQQEPTGSTHFNLYSDAQATLARLCAQCVEAHMGDGEPAPTPKFTEATSVIRALLSYLERHWVTRAVEEGLPGVVHVDELVGQLWEDAVRQRRARAGKDVDSAEKSECLSKKARKMASPTSATKLPRDSEWAPDSGGVLHLQTSGDGGELSVCEVSCAVARALFPVLQHLVEDLDLEVTTETAAVIPLSDVTVCPTRTVTRLVELGTAIVEDSKADSHDTIYPAERVFHAHRELVGGSPAEIHEMLAAANFLGGEAVTDACCFALGLLLTEHYQPQALAFCADEGVLPEKLPAGSGDGKVVGTVDVGESAAAAAAAAAEVVEEHGPRIPFYTDDGKVLLASLDVVRLMAAVRPFVQLGCIQPLTQFAAPCTSPPSWDALFGEMQWLAEHIPTAHTTVRQAVRNLTGIRVPVTSDVLFRVLEWGRHNVHTVDPTMAAEHEHDPQPITGWEEDFCDLPQKTLFELIHAANFLDVKALLDLTCNRVAEMIRGQTPDEIRAQFGIEDEFTEEEMQAVLEENEWLEE